MGQRVSWNRHQSVIVNGSSSEPIPVSSGVPQGSVLGPLLLIYINDLPMNVKSKVRLFADDTTLYLTISTSSQAEILQKDLCNLERWSHGWDMEFNKLLSRNRDMCVYLLASWVWGNGSRPSVPPVETATEMSTAERNAHTNSYVYNSN